jgi:hypothetical protein
MGRRGRSFCPSFTTTQDAHSQNLLSGLDKGHQPIYLRLWNWSHRHFSLLFLLHQPVQCILIFPNNFSLCIQPLHIKCMHNDRALQ